MPSDGLRNTGNDEIRSDSAKNSVGEGQKGQDPSYIYFEQLDDQGNWVEVSRVDYATAKTLIIGAFEEASSEQMEVIQGGVTDNQEFQMNVMTVSVVLIIALMMNFGAIAVQTLLRSFEVRK